MKLLQGVTADWYNPALVKRFYVALNTTATRYLVKADDVVIHFVIIHDSELSTIAKAGDEAQAWLNSFVARLNGDD